MVCLFLDKRSFFFKKSSSFVSKFYNNNKTTFRTILHSTGPQVFSDFLFLVNDATKCGYQTESRQTSPFPTETKKPAF